MKRTPDHISKKKQLIRFQIKAWNAKIDQLLHDVPINPEEKATRATGIRYAEEQIKGLHKAMIELTAQSKVGYLYFNRQI